MIEIGVQTKGMLPEREVNHAFEMIADAGFGRVDLNIDCFLKNSDLYQGKCNSFFDATQEELQEYFMPYKQAMKKYSLRPSQMHAPYPVRVEGNDKQNEYMQKNVIPKCLSLAAFFEVPWVVIHPFKMQYVFDREKEFQENVAYFTTLIPLLKEYNIGVCFENLYESVGGRIVEGVCANPEDAVRYIDTLNDIAGEELFGHCLDTGHLQLVRRNAYEYIKTLGSRLKVLHIHENDTIGDLHQLPFSFGRQKGEGFDWQQFCKSLTEIGFDGTLSFETFPTLNSFPFEMEKDVLTMIHAVGEYFKDEIEDAFPR
ncbi:MAG: sugar phosphate isomerase/epimerase family protein [Lachnospiraceae bacterium]